MKFLVAFVVVLALFASFADAKKHQIKCDLCELVVTNAQQLIAQNNTQQQIVHQMEKACQLLPRKWSGICVAMVDVYGPNIIQSLADHENAEAICHKMHVCKKVRLGENDEDDEDFDDEDFDDEDFEFDLYDFEQELEELFEVEKLEKKHHFPGHNIVKKYKCKACHFLVKKAEHMVKINKAASEIQKALEHECKYFGVKPAVKVCKKIVEKATHKLVEELKKNTSPDHVCHAIHMC